MTETRIYGPHCWQAETLDGPLRKIANASYVDAMATMIVGDEISMFAAAPGTGRMVYKITRMDESGVFGVITENTMRDLHPSEVI